jgi:hypothetical protein
VFQVDFEQSSERVETNGGGVSNLAVKRGDRSAGKSLNCQVSFLAPLSNFPRRLTQRSPFPESSVRFSSNP